MVSTEERVQALEAKHEFMYKELERWGKLVDQNIADLRASEAKVYDVESNVRDLVSKFEQMSRKDKDGPKGLKKAF
eukprot:4903890-Karenia_brevis.AAC.1